MNDKYIELQALITEREGAIALNMQREHLGQSMAYDDGDFDMLAEKMRALKTPKGLSSEVTLVSNIEEKFDIDKLFEKSKV